MFTPESIVALLQHYGYWVLLPIATLEGPFISLLAGLLVGMGILSAPISFGVLMLGDMIGDTIYYSMGYFARRKHFPSWYRYLGITEERVAKLEKHFKNHDWKILFFAKTQALGSVILFSGGFAHMPYKKYMVYNVLGSLPKVALFLTVGYHFIKGYEQIDGFVNLAGIFSILVGVTLLLGYWAFTRYFNGNGLKK